jgi:hypothetical protein
VYGPSSPVKELLKVLVQSFPVPDVDFIYYHQDVLRAGDLSASKLKESDTHVPILVTSKNESEDRFVLFIDWHYQINDHNGGWNRLMADINKIHDKYLWEEKKDKALWRGAASDALYCLADWNTFPRGRAVFMSKFVYPHLIDAGFTRYFKFKRESVDQPLLHERVGLVSHMSPLEQIEYKYLVDIDGISSSGQSLQWKLLSGSAVMKQKSPDVMWFSSQLIPWQHYIPLKADVSDLAERVIWARTNDAEAKVIGENGRNFALEHLTPEHTLLYCFKVLKKYAALQNFQPKAK